MNHQIRDTETLRPKQRSPLTAGFFETLYGKSLDAETGWLGLKCRYAPALPGFPANREFYREFYKIAALGAPETAINGVVTGLPMRIPD